MTADEFKNSLEGELIQKDDAGYDEARAVNTTRELSGVQSG